LRILVIVNESPWGSSLATAALRFVRAAQHAGNRVAAVFFHGDGIYNALPGRVSDDGLPSPAQSWRELAGQGKTELLLCSTASARRLMQSSVNEFPDEFREAGLVEMWDLAERCDRVVTF